MASVAVPNLTYGALLVGYAISLFIYGVTCLQATRYFREYPKDRLFLKSTVSITWFIESLNSALAAHALYYYLIINRGKFPVHIPWSLNLPAATNATSASLIQAFFAWRVYILSNNTFLTILICIFSASQCIFGVAAAIQGNISSNHRFVMIGIMAFATTAATDILIAASLCYYLHTKKTGHSRTNRVVNSIIVLTINNGVFSSTIALVAFITRLALPHTMISFACCFVLGKAYTNTLFSSLNARESQIDHDLTATIPLEVATRPMTTTLHEDKHKFKFSEVYEPKA